MIKTAPIFLSIGITFLSVASHARQDQTAPVRFGSKSLNLEMSEASARTIAGPPTEVVNLVNEYGAPVGRKLIWRISGYNKRTVTAVVEAGTGIVRLNECIGVVADRCD